MSLEFQFTCPLPNGLHARPANTLEQVARGFASEMTLLNQRNGRAASVKSVLALIGADVHFNDSCLFTITGPDEQKAMAALRAFLRDRFPHCDDALPTVAKTEDVVRLPPGLRNSGIRLCRGTAVVPGIVQGRVVTIAKFSIPAAIPKDNTTDIAAEQQKIETALQQLDAWYDERMATSGKGLVRDLLGAHRAMAGDQSLRNFLLEAIATRRRTAAGAIGDADAHFSAMMAASGSALLRERALDIEDICIHLMHLIYGRAAVVAEVKLDTDALVIAETLTPGQFLALDRRFLKGLVLARTGPTSHTVILARSFGIPTLADVHDLAGASLAGQEAVLDAELGALVTNLDDGARRYYVLEQRRIAARQDRLRQCAAQPATSLDGNRLEIAANIATPEEAGLAFAGGAEGIGLFRTEMLFLDRESARDETAQYQAYRRVLEAAGDRTVIIRTLDIGGDKPLEYLNLPREENPFLGMRAVRIYPQFETIFRMQVRALVRASAHGKLKVMLPMIATVEEARWAKKIVLQEQANCLSQDIPFNAGMLLGAMIEVPAAAFIIDALCRELDFFSIGSNDLLQYFMAADRTNDRLTALYDPLQPAFLRLLQRIVHDAHEHQKWIGLCGEMGGEARLLPLMFATGLDEISASACAIPDLKTELAALSLPDCRQLLHAALDCATAGDVAALLDKFAAQRAVPLLEPDHFVLDAECATKEEAIKLAVDQLYILGRTTNPRAVEEAVWQREATYSTGFGHGFAVPHCKCNSVRAGSLVFLKLRSPVDWNSLDGLPVRVVILLVMREADAATAHLKVFAKLSRQVMHEDFRARLESDANPESLCAFLRRSYRSNPLFD